MSSCDNKIDAELIALYTKLAQQPESDFGWSKGKTNAQQLGYSEEWLNHLPDVVWESAAAVGNPFKLSEIKPGEVVLDIGCGAGTDSCIAALLVGEMGKVIGVDCTPAMIDKARNNALNLSLDNIKFHQADFSDLPMEDQSIDVVISNGAINLSVNKESVFLEIYRVLRPKGRLLFADMIRITEDEGCNSGTNTDSWANCVKGTLTADDLLKVMTKVGFIDAAFVELTRYKTASSTSGALFKALRP